MNKQKVLLNVTVESKSCYDHSEKNMTLCLSIIFSFLLSQLFSWPQRPLLVSESRHHSRKSAFCHRVLIYTVVEKKKPNHTPLPSRIFSRGSTTSHSDFFFSSRNNSHPSCPSSVNSNIHVESTNFKEDKRLLFFFPVVRRVQDVFTSPLTPDGPDGPGLTAKNQAPVFRNLTQTIFKPRYQRQPCPPQRFGTVDKLTLS